MSKRLLPADPIDGATQAIRAADGLLICAGAGIGVDSGLPDFRGNEGFWRAYPALAASGVAFTAIASPAAFERDPTRAWGFYGHRLALYRRTVPHAGFALLKSWSDRLEHGAAIYTSNVDGQFQRAGFADKRVCECHGSIHHLQCSEPCSDAIWTTGALEPELDIADCRMTNALPRCPSCDALARPNILMFGDGQWVEHREAGQEHALRNWMASVQRPAILEIGAGVAISTVRYFATRAAHDYRVPLIRINPQLGDLPAGAHGIALGALDGLQAIDARLGPGA
ncbi:hypothetical protein BH10PSE17_BH10PSE17_10300 [soil metagenome]